MNNKGFTLAEILAVIVILAVLIGLAVPNIIGIGEKSKINMFCAKVDNIQNAAQLYGEDHPNNTFPQTITIKKLVDEGYLKKEDDNCNSTSIPCITDPRTNQSIENKTVKIEKINSRITAKYQFDTKDANTCTK